MMTTTFTIENAPRQTWYTANAEGRNEYCQKLENAAIKNAQNVQRIADRNPANEKLQTAAREAHHATTTIRSTENPQTAMTLSKIVEMWTRWAVGIELNALPY